MRTYCLKGEGNSTDDLKHGLKTALYYLLKKTSKLIKGSYLIDDEDKKAEEIDRFVEVLELNHDYLFGDAVYAVNKARNEKLRKPSSLPFEEDILNVRNYTLEHISSIMSATEFDLWDSGRFTELRDLLVCRLTLFNARRGGEPCRLRLREWQDAVQNAWVDESQIEKLDDPLDRALA